MRKTKILWCLLALLCLLAVATVAWRLNLWNIRGVQPSELYLQYKDLPGIQASFIKDKQINDSVRVDVTLLQATDSAGWSQLMSDFKIKELPPEIQKKIDKHSSITIKQLYTETDCEAYTYDAAAISRREHTVAIFHFDSNRYDRDFVTHQIKEIQKKTTLKNTTL